MLLLFSCEVLSDSLAAPWTVALQALLSMGFPRQKYWSGLPFPPLGIFLNQESNLSFLHWQADSLSLSHQGNPPVCILCSSSGVLIFFQSIFKNFHKFCFAIFVANSFQFNKAFFRTKVKKKEKIYIYAQRSQFLTKCLNIVIAISLYQFDFFFFLAD